MFKKLILSTLLYLNALSAVAFDYPLGIPDAWISPDIPKPTSPVYWDEEIPNKYFVEPSNPECTNDKKLNGNRVVPKCVIPTLEVLPAGAYVELHGDNFLYTSKAYIKGAGTESNPVWVVGEEGNSLDIGVVFSGTYIYVDGLNFVNDANVAVRTYEGRKTNNILFRNSSITGTGDLGGKTAFVAQGDSGKITTNVIAYNNHISFNGDWLADVQNDAHALQTGNYINSVWFLNNETHNNGGDGVQMSHGGKEVSHIYYGGNYSWNERENCVDIKQANDIVISTNVCRGIYPVSSANGSCFVVHYDPKRIWFINNDISDCIYGITSTGAYDVHVIGNNIHDIKETPNESHGQLSSYQTGAAVFAYNTGNIYISNNTLTNAVRGISVLSIDGYDLEVTGNIITDLHEGEYTGNESSSIALRGSSSTVSNSFLESNLLNNPFKVYLGSALYEDKYDLHTVGAKCNLGNCSSAKPKFVSDSDHNLLAASEAVDNGYVTNSYQTFFDLYGLNIEADLDYRTRNLTPDMGAYESNQSVLPRQPIKAKDVLIDVVNSRITWVDDTLDTTKIAIYKDDQLYSEIVDVNAGYAAVTNIADTVAKYNVKISNDQGEVVSDSIKSNVVVVTPVIDSLTQEMPIDKSWYIPRTVNRSLAGSMAIGAPEFLQKAYGVPYPKTKFTEGGEELSTGYVYVVGDSKNEIKGAVSKVGNGKVEFNTITNNFSDDNALSEFRFNDSVVKFDIGKSFNQNKVQVEFVDSLSYSFKPVTNEDRTAIGISAIIEK